MTTNYTDLREELTRIRAGRLRWRCPAALREKVVEFTRARQGEGITVTHVAKELGISSSGLDRWLHRGQERLRPVRIVEEPPRSTDLVLVTPSGYRLEGLSIACASEVLRRLGC